MCMVKDKALNDWFKHLIIAMSLLTIALLPYMFMHAPTPNPYSSTTNTMMVLGHDLAINYTKALNYFKSIGGLVIILGPQSLYNEIYQKASELGINTVHYVGFNLPEALTLLMKRPGSILIIDLPYIESSPPAELGDILAPYMKYGIIAFYNATPTMLQDYALNTLLRAKVINNTVEGALRGVHTILSRRTSV